MIVIPKLSITIVLVPIEQKEKNIVSVDSTNDFRLICAILQVLEQSQ